MLTPVKFVLKYFTLECLLERYPNSAELILARTLVTSSQIFIFALMLKNLTHWNCDVSRLKALGYHASKNVPWLGAITGAVYVAFYTRFSAQWSYLANLYNQIKQTEATCPAGSFSDPVVEKNRQDALDDWRVAFIDDAKTLHLCDKKCFASVIIVWGKKPGIRERFVKGLPGEETRFDEILTRAHKAWNIVYLSKSEQPAVAFPTN